MLNNSPMTEESPHTGGVSPFGSSEGRDREPVNPTLVDINSDSGSDSGSGSGSDSDSDSKAMEANQRCESGTENIGSSSKKSIKGKYDGVAPHEGMTFESLDKAKTFYYLYGKTTGFNIKIRETKFFKRSKEIYYRMYSCSREGHARKPKRKEQKDVVEKDVVEEDVVEKRKTLTGKCGCSVSFSVKRKTLDDEWITSLVRNGHNHLLASPRSARNLRNQKIMPSVARRLVENMSEAGLPTGKVPVFLNDELGVNFSSRDCWNHMRNLRRMNLDSGDAASVFNYCRMKQTHDPNFYYSILLDDESRMVNFFWVDSRARLCYEQFGDVLVFDSTYKTNKYGLPCGLFVGVNHHFQSILFGCALLQDETEKSYEWLFQTWLEAMNGKAPVSILTDQDAAIGNSVKKVFPTSAHRLCLWHIMKKFPEKYSNLYRTQSPFKKDMKKCLWQSVSTEEFDRAWNEIMTRYDLKGDAWLEGLFNIRSSWVPVYNRTIFFAGMNTTQRSESMNAFLKEFMNRTTTLKEFVSKYEKVLLKRYGDENKEHYNSKHKNPTNLTCKISEHAATVYTRNIFNMFEDEVKKSLRLEKEKVGKNGCLQLYVVSGDEKYNRQGQFSVSFDKSSMDASCDCRFFEFKGILCRHVLAIFHMRNMDKIPPQYILSRWTKEAADGIPIPMAVEIDKSSLIRTLEFRNKESILMPYLHKSDELYQEIMDGMDKIIHKVRQSEIANEAIQVEEPTTEAIQVEKPTTEAIQVEEPTTEAIQVEEPTIAVASTSIADPLVAKTKGRPRNSAQQSSNGRYKSGFEIAMTVGKTKRRKCSICHEEGHYKSGCKKQK